MSTRELIGADLFSTSAQRIVDYLNVHTPLSDWSVSRVAGGEQIHVHVHHQEVLGVGDRVPWDVTFCSRMSKGAAHVVPDSLADPDYADHPDAPHIRAYAGYPITDDDGTTFGVLCGVDRSPVRGSDQVDADLIALMSELLSSQLAMSRAADRERRATEIAEALAQTDALTGVVNRRGWDLLVDDAQQRIDAYGDLVAVGVVDLDGLKAVNDADGHAAGDALIRLAAGALDRTAVAGDRVARYGGDEFAILSNNVAPSKLAEHFARFGAALADAGVEASIGHASTGPGEDVVAAFARADADMYAVKQSRRGHR